jgi:WD40 repeat protein
MHAERDYLVKKVFPRLSAWCEERKLRLIDIDLRWGVSEADATENKRVVQVCLDRIDACRPFFLCLLGQRRGWVPGESDVSAQTLEQFPGLKEKGYLGNYSITEMEIEHALLAPMLSLVDGVRHTPEPDTDAFFYFRDDDYLSALPTAHRAVFTNEAIIDEAGRLDANANLESWKQRIRAEWTGVRDYTCVWDETALSPELTDQGVAELTTGRLARFECGDQSLEDMIVADLKKAILTRFPERETVADAGGEELDAEQQHQFAVLAGEGFIERKGDFTALDEYVAGGEGGRGSQSDRDDPADRADQASQASRPDQADQAAPLVLVAPPGRGKTMLLARFAERASMRMRVVARFAGASDLCATFVGLWQSLCAELGQECPATLEELRESLPSLLATVGKQGETLIIIDALNQLQDGVKSWYYLPRTLPPGIRLIVSFKTGDQDADQLHEALRREGRVPLTEVRPFASLADRADLVDAYLQQYLKDIDDRHKDAICARDGAENPLYLKVLLSELRVFGSFGQLDDVIRLGFGETPQEAFLGVLARMESDPVYYPSAPPRTVVPLIFGLLAVSRGGLAEDELLACLSAALPQTPADDLEGVTRQYLRQMRPFLARRAGRWDFLYESFALASQQRYADSASADHGLLSDYFISRADPNSDTTYTGENPRAFAEAPYHTVMAGRRDAAAAMLWNYRFLDRKLTLCGVNPLIDDYRLASQAPAPTSVETPSAHGDTSQTPHNPAPPRPAATPAASPATLEEQSALAVVGEALRLSAHILSAIPEQLSEQLWGRLIDRPESQIRSLLEQAAASRTSPWLRPMSGLLNSPGSGLVKSMRVGEQYPAVISPDGRYLYKPHVDNTAQLEVWDVDDEIMLRIIDMEGMYIHKLYITQNGRWLVVSGSSTVHWNGVMVYDLDADRLAFTVAYDDIYDGDPVPPPKFPGRFDYYTFPDAVLTDDGATLIVGSDRRTVYVWNLADACLDKKLEGFNANPEVLDIRGDLLLVGEHDPRSRQGIHYYSGGFVGHADVGLFDLKTADRLYRFDDCADEVNAVALSPDARLAAATVREHKTRVWDAHSGRQIADLSGHHTPVWRVVFSPDSKHLVTAASEPTLLVFDVTEERPVARMPGHSGGISSLSMSNDGVLMVKPADHYAQLWDIAAVLAAPPRDHHADGAVGAVAIRADGTVLSSSYHAREPGDGNVYTEEGDTRGLVMVWGADGHARHEFGLARARNGDLVRFSPDGERAVATYAYQASEGGRRGIKQWSLARLPFDSSETNSPTTIQLPAVGMYGFAKQACLSADGRYGFDTQGAHDLNIYDIAAGIQRGKVTEPRDDISLLDGADVSSSAGVYVLWGSDGKVLRDWKNNRMRKLIDVIGQGVPESVFFSLDGTRLYAVTSRDIMVFDTTDGRKLDEFLFSDISSATLSACGSILAVATEERMGTSGSILHGVWLLQGDTLSPICHYYFDAESSNIACDHDGELVVFGDAAGMVHQLTLVNHTPETSRAAARAAARLRGGDGVGHEDREQTGNADRGGMSQTAARTPDPARSQTSRKGIFARLFSKK